MLFSKVGVYKTEQDGQTFIVELGQEAEDAVHSIHVSSPLGVDAVRHLLRHVDLSDAEIDSRLEHATTPAARAASASR